MRPKDSVGQSSQRKVTVSVEGLKTIIEPSSFLITVVPSTGLCACVAEGRDMIGTVLGRGDAGALKDVDGAGDIAGDIG